MTPTRCIDCQGPLDGSLEHPFSQALGATKANRSIYCGACNTRIGTEVDGPFTAVFEILTTLLDVRRARNEPPSLPVTTSDGQRITIGPGGIPSARDPVTTVAAQGDPKSATIVVPANRIDLVDHMIAKVAKQRGVDKASIKVKSMAITSTSAGSIPLHMSLGGPAQVRGASKIALGFLALAIGDDVFQPPYARLRRAVAAGGETIAWVTPKLPGLAADFLPASDGAQHHVVIYSTDTETWAHIEVLETFAYGVLIAEQPDARFATPYVWGQNATTGESGEGFAASLAIPPPARALRGPRREDIEALGRTLQRRMLAAAQIRTIEEEVALFGASLEDGDEVDEARINRLSRRVAERLVAMSHPDADLDLTLSVDTRDELDRLCRALRTPKKRPT